MLVQAIGRNLTAAGTTQTTTAIATTSGNNLLFFAIYNAASAGVPTPSDSTSLVWSPISSSPFSGSATGLTLAIWQAQNITGNAVNTFTFATTGSDTPTIFVAESSGRDKFTPLDLGVTASDSTATSGAHTTGVINANGGDDVIALLASSVLAQSFSAAGGWAIPPNGTITSGTGYDAFIQYQNNVAPGAISNVYSVVVSDKLDAFIVALRQPKLAISDEWLDYFDEVPEVYALSNGYYQLALSSFAYEIDFDWIDDSGENDSLIFTEDQSGPVIANAAVNAANQYYGEDAELFDEVIDFIPLPVTYQTQDRIPVSANEESWSWANDDAYEFSAWTPGSYQQADLPNLAALPFYSDTDWDEDPDDFFADDFGNDDADLPQNDTWDHFPTDDDDYVVTDDFLNINANTGLLFLNIEDGWDQEHFQTADSDETWTEDNYENDVNLLLNQEDPTWWDEEPDQLDGTTTDLEPVGSNNNPDLSVEDQWDHFPTDDDDYPIIDDYTLVDLVANQTLTIEDAYDWFPADPDDETYQALDTDSVGPTLIIPISMPPEDPWDHTQAEDDYVTPDDYAIVDVPLNLSFPSADPWDWTQDDDDYVVIDDYVYVNNKPITIEDPWDWTQDADDDSMLTIDAPIAPAQMAAIDDPWNHSQEIEDDEWIYRDSTISIIPPSLVEDPWDWTQDDSDNDISWALTEYSLVNLVIPFSQFTDDSWDWAYEPAEDQDIDWAITDGPLVPNLYIYDCNYEVFMPHRTFTVIWLPDHLES
jgi:hypothetical protein